MRRLGLTDGSAKLPEPPALLIRKEGGRDGPSLAAKQVVEPAGEVAAVAADVPADERLARLRSLRAIARLTLGPRGEAFAQALHRAETDPDQLEPALASLDALAALDRRAVLCSFAALHRLA